MENKKTTELIDLLHTLMDKKGNLKPGYGEALEELKSREPFWTIFDEDFDEGIPMILESLKEIRNDIKLLKRHKHDERTGDVVIRI